jgi:hypothetical protein
MLELAYWVYLGPKISFRFSQPEMGVVDEIGCILLTGGEEDPVLDTLTSWLVD